MQDAVHAQAEKYRDLGLDENSDYIQDLQKQWWDYQDSIQEVIVGSYEAVVSEWENAIELTENRLENAINNRNMDEVEQFASDIVAYYKNLQAKVHEEAEYYRSLGYSDTSDEISELSNLWWEYGNSVIEVMNRVVETSSDAVDQIQDVYDILHNAANEYADGGYITVDTLQDIINMGAQYMQLLTDENGQLVINEERINAVIAARAEQLALESAMNYVERLRLALQAGSLEELNNLLFATTETTNATWGLVYANLALLNLDDSQYQAALHNINALRSLAQNAISGIGQVSNSTSEALEEMKTGLDDILKYVMEMLKQRINDQIQALEDMKSAYRDIIDLRKEALDAAKKSPIIKTRLQIKSRKSLNCRSASTHYHWTIVEMHKHRRLNLKRKCMSCRMNSQTSSLTMQWMPKRKPSMIWLSHMKLKRIKRLLFLKIVFLPTRSFMIWL